MTEKILVYVGTYTRGESEGIYIYRMDPETGSLEPVGKAINIMNPSFLAISPQKSHLYAVNEVQSFSGERSGAVSSFRINQETGELTLLNSKPSGGTSPCYVTVDGTGRNVLAANYSSGSLCVLPVMEDGTLGDATEIVQHEGSSVNPKRQEGPHAHSIVVDPSNRYVYAADLGIDKIMIYKFDSDKGKLTPNDQPWVSTQPGAGPRHFTFHPNEKFAYVINELDSTIVAFSYDGESGRLKPIQTVSTLPEGYEGINYPADIHVSPSGRFLYGSNRGHDSIVIYRIDEETGRLSLIGHESTRGQFPRNFAIDPTGDFLLAANQNSNNIVGFRIDQETGLLEPTGEETRVPTPVCIKFLPLP
jgi:6-phosphogluconolactonase